MSAVEDHLVATRERQNAVLAGARSRGADVGALGSAVRELPGALDPLESVLGREALGAVVDAAVGAAAELVVRGRWNGSAIGRWALLDVLPFLAPWLSAAPAETVAAVVDGSDAVARAGDVAAWSRRVVDASRVPDVAWDGARVRAAVLVASWRSGLVRYRRAALAAAGDQPLAVARAALGLPADADVGDVLRRNATDPWSWPGAAVSGTVARVGGFRGVGGPWLGLPVVAAPEEGHEGSVWWVWTTEPDPAWWRVAADVHGHAVVRSDVGPDGTPAPPGPRPPSAVVRVALEHPDGVVTLAAATVQRSYRLGLQRWVRPA